MQQNNGIRIKQEIILIPIRMHNLGSYLHLCLHWTTEDFVLEAEAVVLGLQFISSDLKLSTTEFLNTFSAFNLY